MKTKITILALTLVQMTTFAQLQWQKCLGGISYDIANSIQLTPDGGYIMAGTTRSTDGVVIGNHGDNDAWVVKLTATGAIDWQKALGGTGDDRAQSFRPTPDGGYILAGYTLSTDGDLTGNYGGGNVWVVKLDATGAIVWQKTMGGTSYDYANSIQLTPDGGYILACAGYSINGDVTGNHGGFDYWVVKLDATGAIVWQKALGGTDDDLVKSIQLTPDGGYIVAGSTYSTDGDVTGNHGYGDAWVVKLSGMGVLVWQKTLGGTAYDNAYSIQPSPDSGYIVACETSSINGDVTGKHGGMGDADAWVVKLSNVGTIEWQKALGGTGKDYAYSIQPTTDGGYIMAGFTDSTDGDVTGNHGGRDAWIVKLDATGNIVWQKTLGGTNDDSANSIQLNPDGGYIMIGNADSKNGDLTGNHGITDAWIVKLTPTGTIVWQKNIGGSDIDNILSIQFTTDGGYIVAGYTSSNDGYVIGNHGGSDAWVVKLGPDPLATATFATQELKLYPNPAKSILQLQTATNASLDKITITDLTGKVIITQTTNTAQINIEPLASGMYILEATSGEEKYCSKFVKE